jgi:hypothetical protein
VWAKIRCSFDVAELRLLCTLVRGFFKQQVPYLQTVILLIGLTRQQYGVSDQIDALQHTLGLCRFVG